MAIGLDMDVQTFREFVAEQLLQKPIDTVRLWIGEQKLTDESATLQSCGLREGVEVYGGFCGGESDRSERVIESAEGAKQIKMRAEARQDARLSAELARHEEEMARLACENCKQWTMFGCLLVT